MIKVRNSQHWRVWLCSALLAVSLPAAAGMYGAQPPASLPMLSERIEHDVREIMMRHGMPISQEGEDPWFSVRTVLNLVGVGEVSYLLYLDRMNEVPLAARIEIIEYCMRLHEARGRNEYMRLQMRTTPRQQTLMRPKPEFELVLGDSR